MTRASNFLISHFAFVTIATQGLFTGYNVSIRVTAKCQTNKKLMALVSNSENTRKDDYFEIER